MSDIKARNKKIETCRKQGLYRDIDRVETHQVAEPWRVELVLVGDSFENIRLNVNLVNMETGRIKQGRFTPHQVAIKMFGHMLRHPYWDDDPRIIEVEIE